MIKEALEYLANLGKATANPQLVPMGEGNHDERVFVINGEIHTLPVRPLPRCHNVNSLEDLIAAAERFSIENKSEETGTPSVFYNHDQVQLVIDDGEQRRNTVTFEFDPSEIVESLKRFNSHWLDQKSFLRMLKIDLRGTINSPGLLDAIKSLRFENSATTVGTIDRSKESMGRELKSSVNSKGDELPEEIVFQIPLYSNPCERQPYSITAALETDAIAAKLRYCILPEEYDIAVETHLADVNERLRERLEDKAHIYQGNA